MKKVIKKKTPTKTAAKSTKKIVVKKPINKKVLTVKSTPKSKKRSWLGVLGIANVVAFVVVLIVNYLAVSLPLGGMTT